jgi:hypothetical protein
VSGSSLRCTHDATADIETAIGALTAFADDPLTRWLLPGDPIDRSDGPTPSPMWRPARP